MQPTETTAGKRKALGVLLWGIFGAGLLVQAFAPRLQIANHAFIMPSSLVSEGQELNPAEIIKERRMQLLSGVLTVGGALGLAFYYRRVLFKSHSP